MLGAGGMGTVYAAVGERGERVAVKVVHAGQAADEQFRARFRREVQVLRRVSGPCLVPLLEADPGAETPWLATAYVPGLTLAQHTAAHGPLAGIQLHLLAAGTAGALAAVHAVGVVHRDLKPANVILAPDGPRVLDFGIAHVADGTAVTRTGMLTGTPGWLSPEYYRDGTAGPPGDVFAWGALLAFAATGRHPFGTGNAEAVAFRVLNGEPDLAGVPDELAGVAESCLAKDPVHRPPAAAVAEKTAELLGEQATQVLGAFHDRPTEVPNLLAQQWHPPTVEDPAWPTPATRRPIGRAWLTVIAAAVFAASATGTWLALAPGHAQARGNQPLRATAARSTPVAGPATSSSPTGRPTASAPSQTPAAVVSSVQATQTQVVTIIPWSPDGTPAGGITVTGRSSGSCFGTAESTMRTDAWRCSAGDRILDPCFSPDLGGHPFTGRMQTCCLRGQVCGRILLRALFGGSPFGTGQPPHPLEVEGLGLGERPGQAQLRSVWDQGRVRDGEGLQVDAGRLSPQLSQPSDGGIALRLLLRSFRLTACPLQLGG
ncbi:serine/threonine-protein kinase [Streptomyces sp. NPDC059340]|uniref:serine/threonine-protein kinase n=1 Tax=Streptomyces sp. NPDC059340 TaxID=3346806 RepID=UPI0036C2C7E4